MHSRTLATLDRLDNSDWFSNVGTYDGIDNQSRVRLLSSWDEAVESCSSSDWRELCLEAVTQYRKRIHERAPGRLNQWNNIMRVLNPIVVTLVEEKTAQVVEKNYLPRDFVNSVRFDILHACIESEYADVYPPGYYVSQAYWYTKGHFPCGWTGPFPYGVVSVY